MKLATTLRLTIAMLALGVAVASAQVLTPETATRAADVTIDVTGGPQITPNSTNFAGIVYDNTTAVANAGFSSTSLASVWGDELFTTNPGILSGFKFSLYNSSSSVGSLLTAACTLSFYDGATATYLGGFNTNVNFGAGLAKGSYSIITVTGLDALAITLNTTDINKRKELYFKMQEIVAKDVPSVILDFPKALVAVNKRVVNLEPKAVGTRNNVEQWAVTDGK
jgi:hypothetical protein